MTAEGANNKSQKLAEALKAAASIASLLADQRAKKKVTLSLINSVRKQLITFTSCCVSVCFASLNLTFLHMMWK